MPSDPDRLIGRDPDELRAAIAQAAADGDMETLETLTLALEAAGVWEAQDYQKPPDTDWFAWLFLAGAGAGKTDVGCHWVAKHVEGPACDPRAEGGHRVALLGQTIGGAVDALYSSPSGFRVHAPGSVVTQTRQQTAVLFPNGTRGRVFGTDTARDVDQLRPGANCCVVLCDEAALYPLLDAAYDQLLLRVLRLGKNPRLVITTTPKPRALVKQWVAFANEWREAGHPSDWPPDRRIALTRANSFQNRYLPEVVRSRLLRFEGTRLGRQEIYAEILDDYEGALWNRGQIDADRVASAPELVRIGIGVDPSSFDPEDTPRGESEIPEAGQGLETGIVAAGIAADQQVYALADASGRHRPEVWGQRAVDLYHQLKAHAIVVEKNAQGALATSTIRVIDPSVNVVAVTARSAKRIRAEPVAALSEQHRLHHVGTLPILEDVLCTWDPREPWSPDRMDAYVHAVTYLEPWADLEVSSSARRMADARL